MPNTGPSPEVLAFFKAKNIRPSYNWKDVFEEEHAFSFTVAKATEIEVLNTLKDDIERAIKEGLSFEGYQKIATTRLQELGWWGKKEAVDPKTGEKKLAQLGSKRRLETIFNTNIRTANAAGKWERIERTKKLIPYLQYSIGPSIKHRPQHVALNRIVLPVDDSFWNTHYPPNGWGCKCYVRHLTKEAGEKIGVNESPKLEFEQKLNPRTGRIERKYSDIDFGFASNPGKTRLQTLASYATNNLATATALQASNYFKQLMQNKDYKEALTKDYQNWLDSVKRAENTTTNKVVYVLNKEVIDYFENSKNPLKQAAVILEGKIANKLIENSNIGLENLIDDLLNFKSILFDKSKNDLIVILQAKDNKDTLTKVVITLQKYSNNIIDIKEVSSTDLKNSNLKLLQNTK